MLTSHYGDDNIGTIKLGGNVIAKFEFAGDDRDYETVKILKMDQIAVLDALDDLLHKFNGK